MSIRWDQFQEVFRFQAGKVGLLGNGTLEIVVECLDGVGVVVKREDRLEPGGVKTVVQPARAGEKAEQLKFRGTRLRQRGYDRRTPGYAIVSAPSYAF